MHLHVRPPIPRLRTGLAVLAAAAVLFVLALSAQAGAAKFKFGLLLVGPANDHGWSQAHFEAGRRVERELPGVEMLYIDKVNPADRPGITVPMLVDDLVAKGAQLIIANSDDMKDGVREAALLHPEIFFIHISGDDALTGKGPKNLANLMGRMEFGKMMAGFVAALTTKTGKIGYLGPLINDETRRLAAAAYLGARYGWTRVLGRNPGDLRFKVSWIGFWFNIPGVTSDPSLVASQFYDSGFDVVISGIDTTEALVVAGQKRQAGKQVWAVPYDFRDGCSEAPEACLGVPYFNWYPGYRHFVQAAMQGRFRQEFLWLGPNWQAINDPDTSSIGFLPGDGLPKEAASRLAEFQDGLANGAIDLFQGPLAFQDGSVYLKAGEKATDRQIWYLPQLLQGMEGQSK